MTVRFVRLAALTITVLACTVPAQAGHRGYQIKAKAEAAWHCLVRDTCRRHCWPEPFMCPDREAVWAPFGVMVHNGWRSQNMLVEHHFVGQTGELSDAGRYKVRWIVKEAPAQHRIIYVHKTDNAELTADRVAQVQQHAADLAQGDQLPMILETDASAYGWPASRADLVSRKFEAAQPAPTLPAAEGADSGD